MSTKKTSNKPGKEAGKAKAQKRLPKNVTPEPQDGEHMHLKHIMHSPALVDVYLAVSDDDGKLLGDKRLEKRVIAFIKEYKTKDASDLKNLDSVLKDLQALYQSYSTQINMTHGKSEGVTTKYRIRQAMLLIIEKKLLKKNGKQWVEYFSKTYGQKYLRSAQDYMALARTPNIIRYAVYGKERLMEILRAIKELGIKSDDPVASFLEQYKIPYNPKDPQSEETLLELKVEIDYAVAMTKIRKVERDHELPLDLRVELIKRLIGMGIKIGNGLIKDLLIVKKATGDVNLHLEDVYITGGRGHELLKPIKKVTGFPRLVADVKNTVNYIREHDDLADRIEQSQIEELEQCVSDLKDLTGDGND